MAAQEYRKSLPVLSAGSFPAWAILRTVCGQSVSLAATSAVVSTSGSRHSTGWFVSIKGWLLHPACHAESAGRVLVGAPVMRSDVSVTRSDGLDDTYAPHVAAYGEHRSPESTETATP